MENGSSRVALVTGAARGIGRGIALRLAADGLDVALNDIGANADQLDGVAEEIRGAGRRTATVVADVSVPDEVENMVGRVADELGHLDVMVANAGIAQVAPLLEVTPEQFDGLMAVNLRGVFLCYTAAARQMIRQGGGGKIIGAASIAAHKGFAMLGHYSASKWAVRGLTQRRPRSGPNMASPSTRIVRASSARRCGSRSTSRWAPTRGPARARRWPSSPNS
jgi:meso-butanediol dehydrogenase/(S,S)-butanediol dehydrogenase/diacetyl reductase